MDKTKVGILMLMIGASMGDSDNLIIPAIVILSGVFLVWRGSHAR